MDGYMIGEKVRIISYGETSEATGEESFIGKVGVVKEFVYDHGVIIVDVGFKGEVPVYADEIEEVK